MTTSAARSTPALFTEPAGLFGFASSQPDMSLNYLADVVEVLHDPPISGVDKPDARWLRNIFIKEAEAINSVMRDHKLIATVTVVGDEIVSEHRHSGTLMDGKPYSAQSTIYYQVEGGKIVRLLHRLPDSGSFSNITSALAAVGYLNELQAAIAEAELKEEGH